MQLVIVESPTKAKAIQHYLGPDYIVTASKGHIRNIRKKPFGVDLEDGFKVSYEQEPKAGKIISELKKQVKAADSVILATDPDREGEAIAWHLCDVLKINPKTPCRIEYQEVTKKAVLDAMKHPRPLDMHLVDAALTRSALDYIVGFKVSPLLWKKVARNLSAGRVQTPVLHLICERERERNAFVPEESWTVEASVWGLDAVCKEKYKTEKEARKTEEEVKDSLFKVVSVDRSSKTGKPRPPFTTSTLQQAAVNQLGMDIGIVMSVAQKLFEGIKIDGELTGLITYMRTDSVRVSEEAITNARKKIREAYGETYLPEQARRYGPAGNAQDAHEAIRPTDLKLEPDRVRGFLTEDQYKLYRLIYGRFLASQMADSRTETATVSMDAAGHIFRASVSRLLFPGYRKAYATQEESGEAFRDLPEAVKPGSETKADAVKCEQHFTKPEPRYTQASMIKQMEEDGIGRPSTYASMIRTVKDRGYVEQNGKALAPRELGFITDEKLQSYFSIFNIDFTKNMEEKLDAIAGGKAKKTDTLKKYWEALREELNNANEKMPKWTGESTDKICPVCGGKMKQRLAQGGLFFGCSNYPACNYVWAPDDLSGPVCKTCGQKTAKRHKANGTVFFVCVNGDCPECAKSKAKRKKPERQWKEGVELLDWARTIKISKRPCTTTRMASRISQADPQKRKTNSKTLDQWLEKNGYLEKRADKYGKERYLPTEKGTEAGFLTDDRKTVNTSYEIAVMGESAQRAVIQELKNILS